MAMEFGKISKMSVSNFAMTTATEGGAVVAGLLGAGFAGKQIENQFKPGVTAASPMMDKVVAILANDGTKLLGYYLLRKHGMEMTKSESGKAMVLDVGKGFLGSAVLDLLVRSGNDFAPGTTVKVFGIDLLGSSTNGANATPQMQANMQKVLQENSSLRAQLNSALQRVASASPNVTVTPVRTAAQIPPSTPASDKAYGVMPTRGNPKYGTMPVDETPSQRNFGQMNDMSVDGGAKTLGSMFNFD